MALTSFLNYNRSISPSEGLLYGLRGEIEKPVLIVEKTVRGSISNYIDPNKQKEDSIKDLNAAGANIQRIDAAFLDHDAKALVLKYSIVIHGGALVPSGCDSSEVRESLKRIVGKAIDKGGFDALADRYAWNIVNARGLWRNRLARKKCVEVTIDDEATLKFESDNINTFKFEGAAAMPGEFERLSKAISAALQSREQALFLRVRITGELPPGAEVYPSQEFTEEEKTRGGDKKGRKSRKLSGKPIVLDGEAVRHASLHSQKLGNALRCIDDWHPQADDLGAVAVETYGFSQSALKTLRMPKRSQIDGEQGTDFYGILDDLPKLEAQIDEAEAGKLPSDILYFLAVLVRGGVFSGGKRKEG